MNRGNFFLFLGVLYSFIPFETSDSRITLTIRLLILVIFTTYIFIKNKIDGNSYKTLILLAVLISIYFGALESLSLYLFIFLTSIISVYIISNAIENNFDLYQNFVQIWEYLLIFSIIMLLLQQLSFILTGNMLKMHELIFPISKARVEIIKQLHLIRFGGIYIEPGTYANFMYLFLVIYMVIKKNFNTTLVSIASLSIISTMSVWGMIFGTYLLLISILIKVKKTSTLKKFFIIFTLITTTLYGTNTIPKTSAYKYAKLKLKMKSDSGHSKVIILNRFKENLPNYVLIGDGFDSKIVKNVTAPQDAGLIFNLSIVFGILFSLTTLIIYSINIINRRGFLILIASTPLLISKIFYWEFSFWLLFFLSFGKDLNITNRKV